MPPGIALAMAAWLGTAAAMMVIARLLGPQPPPLWQVAGAMSAAVLATLLALAAAQLPLAAHGLRWPSWRAWGWGLLAGPAGLLVSLLAALVVFAVVGRPPGEQVVERIVAHLLATYGFWGTVLLAAALPGIVEEALFRGVVLHALQRHWPNWLAIAVSALAFGLLHLDPWRLAPQTALGLLLGWLTVRSGSCLPAMLAHAVHNALVLALVRAGY